MNRVYGLGILGCGDFTRIQSPVLQQSRPVRVAAVYDPNEAAARTAAERLGARVLGSAEALIADATVEIVVVVYTPSGASREGGGGRQARDRDQAPRPERARCPGHRRRHEGRPQPRGL